MAKRLIAIGDLHCGHVVGVTPPEWEQGDRPQHHAHKTQKIRRACWEWLVQTAKRLGRPDVLVVNGDAIEGKGARSGGTELLEADRSAQADMAAQAIGLFHARHIVMTYGTAYHVSGDGEDWEQVLADKVAADKLGAHEWVEIAGTVWDFKHHVSGSGVPHGRKTAVSREELWNLVWSDAGLQPRADWVCRSHVHYHEGGFRWYGRRQVWAMTLPPLQAMGSKYGARTCSGTVDVGLVVWDVGNGGDVTWHAEMAHIPAQQARASRF